MKIAYDREVDALYIRLKETTVTTNRVEEGIALDYDAAGRIAGIEILDLERICCVIPVNSDRVLA